MFVQFLDIQKLCVHIENRNEVDFDSFVAPKAFILIITLILMALLLLLG